MIEQLLARASTRFIFVVGKGGVGKSTTAAAVALALADRSRTVHLISTDPAHSIADVFEQALQPGVPTSSSCNPALALEEFAAHPYADAFFADLRGPLIQLIERGTYLTESDATGFLDLSVPGIDEVMSALRLVELYQGNNDHVVVDTAPTGHTLRLLESARVIESWVAAGRAMAEKAGVVATYLVGTPIRLEAESHLDALAERARLFDAAVLRAGSAILVTRAGEVVVAETRRLLSELRHRDIAVAAVVSVAADSGGDFTIGVLERPYGCAGLRDWAHQLRPGAAAVHAATTDVMHVHTSVTPELRAVEAWIHSLSARLIFVVGKGGVGKSTCASALALALAQQRRVCMVSTDPAGSLAEVWRTPVGAEPGEVAPGLHARQIDARAEFERLRQEYRDGVDALFERLGLESSLRLDRNVIDSLWNFAPPGLDELVALAEILESLEHFDALVIDTAPTGHFLRLLELPEIALEWVHALLRLLLNYSATPNLDAFARDLLRFAKRLRQLQLDLSTPRAAAVFVVTLDQPLVAAETARLSSAMEHAGLPIVATIVNRDGTRKHATHAHRIRAPEMRHEITGPAALREFVREWEFQ